MRGNHAGEMRRAASPAMITSIPVIGSAGEFRG